MRAKITSQNSIGGENFVEFLKKNCIFYTLDSYSSKFVC